ncbi:MAG: helix-turn-helix domain-containing protein [Anaerolineales bacterium]|nr:helix-turn-helix domain-containing protein [Chloroflexota bacterium]MBL6980936.1 helix-turn-helix domain-containing protein [Anaerolineales bacterium]
MVSFNVSSFPVVLNNLIPVKAAAEFSGYSMQYLRRLLRSGRLSGLKVGQVWLIDKTAFDTYLEGAKASNDRRFGPK